MARELALAGPPSSERDAKKKVTAAVKSVARKLGNTATVCRECYIHPAIPEAYRAGTFPHACHRYYRPRGGNGLSADERFMLRVLEAASASPEGETTHAH